MRLVSSLVVVASCAISLGAQAPTGPRAGVDWPGFRSVTATDSIGPR